jgi:hypothetical protein
VEPSYGSADGSSTGLETHSRQNSSLSQTKEVGSQETRVGGSTGAGMSVLIEKTAIAVIRKNFSEGETVL